MIKNMQSYLDAFYADGVVVIPSVLTEDYVALLRQELVEAIAKDEADYPDAFDRGMVHNCMFRGDLMASLLDEHYMNTFVARILSETFILYAYQSSSLLPGHGNYGSRVHVDCPRFIEGYTTNVGVIFPLDDFTSDNGATYYLPGSHLLERPPEEDCFYADAKRCLCNKGDMIVFSGRLWHAAGYNGTGVARHSLTLNLCRSYMRQRFDFARMISNEMGQELTDNIRKLLGWSVRMPTSLDEFYLPEAERLYKPNQG